MKPPFAGPTAHACPRPDNEMFVINKPYDRQQRREEHSYAHTTGFKQTEIADGHDAEHAEQLGRAEPRGSAQDSSRTQRQGSSVPQLQRQTMTPRHLEP